MAYKYKNNFFIFVCMSIKDFCNNNSFVSHRNYKNKKDRFELCVLEEFVSQMRNDELAEIFIKEHSDSPDFIVENNCQLIGLEITRLVNETEYKPGQDVRMFIESVKKEFEKLPNISVGGYINFTLQEEKISNWNKSQKVSSGKKLAEIVHQKITGKKIDKPDFLIEIDFLHTGSGAEIIFNSLGAYSLKKLNYELLKNTISQKEAKLDEYLTRTSNIPQWLLVIADANQGENFSYIDGEAFNIQSKFNSVYIYHRGYREVYKLK